MTRSEFLEKLKEALADGMDSYIIQGHLNYYRDYIQEEVQKGRSEEEVLSELGDPWVIARSLLEAPGQGSAGESYSDAQVYHDDRKEDSGYYGGKHKVYRLNSFWGKLAVILVVVGIIFLIFSIVSGIITLLAPVVVPVIIIVLLINFFKNRR
ncbi:DUF1700 domain-containing protein [Coprococcus sp. AF21-14LB]|uniref:DUF1700 domain-containing protein n=1 Tax=Coprococcus sp. AF21-14LB TaxID=2292231 RepID=UPI000E514E90|nr:DUF1700 domain-containing protein [Coprococcus sp. AF21-14LB]RGS81864.1 DUF1700 domain-containing protein [Coprococcus sp. AF21-14LB]